MLVPAGVVRLSNSATIAWVARAAADFGAWATIGCLRAIDSLNAADAIIVVSNTKDPYSCLSDRS